MSKKRAKKTGTSRSNARRRRNSAAERAQPQLPPVSASELDALHAEAEQADIRFEIARAAEHCRAHPPKPSRRTGDAKCVDDVIEAVEGKLPWGKPGWELSANAPERPVHELDQFIRRFDELFGRERRAAERDEVRFAINQALLAVANCFHAVANTPEGRTLVQQRLAERFKQYSALSEAADRVEKELGDAVRTPRWKGEDLPQPPGVTSLLPDRNGTLAHDYLVMAVICDFLAVSEPKFLDAYPSESAEACRAAILLAEIRDKSARSSCVLMSEEEVRFVLAAARRVAGDIGTAVPPLGEECDTPDATGFVKSPTDPEKYTPRTRILKEYPIEGVTARTMDQFLKKNQIRWTRPSGDPHRRSIHLDDWCRLRGRLPDQSHESAGKADPSPAEIIRRAQRVRASKS